MRNEVRLNKLEHQARASGGTRIFVMEPEDSEHYHSEGETFTRAEIDAFEREHPHTQVVIISWKDVDSDKEEPWWENS